MDTAATLQMDLAPLLAGDEPPPLELVNPCGGSPLLILCDHASNRIPRALNGLGIDPHLLERHIAYDLGCEAVCRHLAYQFDARLMLSGYSRLVIDLNRHPGDGSSIPEMSDGIVIPGNRALSPDEIRQRENILFWPYHAEVERQLSAISSSGQAPIVCAIHSFTPVFRGFQRPWHIGVLWDRDRRLSDPLLQQLRRVPGICVGDNQPYHARNPVGYSMDIHGEHKGNQHVLLEIRQDLIVDAAGAEHWAGLIHDNVLAVMQSRPATEGESIRLSPA